MTEKTVIILRETLVESIGKDVSTVLSAFAMIVPGWFIGSGALQWIGATIFGLWLVARASAVSKIKTIAEARKFLDELEKRS